MRRRVTTHLVIPDSSYASRKLGVAQEWGLQVVYPSWLRELAERSPFREESTNEPTAMDIDLSTDVSLSRFNENRSSGKPKAEMEQDGPLKGCCICISPKLEVSNTKNVSGHDILIALLCRIAQGSARWSRLWERY